MEKSDSDEITEEEFDALLDAIDAQKDPVVETAAITTSELIPLETSSDNITEEEFDAVLDRLEVEKKIPSSGAVAVENATSEIVDEYLTDLCVDVPEAEIIQLAPNISIADAADLQSELIKLLSGTGEIRIEAANVEAIDTAVMQLFYAFIHEVTNNGRAVVWSDPSATLLHNARMLGLTEYLKLPATDAKAA